LRFAPSPTGFFHVGGARTALYNWLVARSTGGTFVLRIEDTDAERNREEWVEGIKSAMRWVGVDWDEGPYRQSERTHLHADACRRLVELGSTYYCDCTGDEVKSRNAARYGASGEMSGYDRHCRERGLDAAPGRALRFRTPLDGATIVPDLIRGQPSFENAALEDFVIARGDGSATFILANVVDDIDMRITHVVRGEEHLSNTPKAILLWQALAPDLALPVFAHVPVLVNDKRQKLSKRRDKVAVEDYRDLGVLPEAMRNYLVLLGWAPGNDREILTVHEMIAEFRLEDVNASPAFFDLVKLSAFNGEYIRALPVVDFVNRCEPWLTGRLNPWDPNQPTLPGFPPERYDAAVFTAMAPMVQERVRLLSEVPGVVDFLFREKPEFDPDSWAKAMLKGPAVEMLDGFVASLDAVSEWTAEALKAVTEQVGEGLGLKLGKAQAPVRVAVTGRTVGPPLFESLELLGRAVTLDRVRAARALLS
jgi:glutamyl-tRNA synthetase